MLRQDPTECLLSFLCSSNNNISRICQMLDKFRAKYGECKFESAPGARYVCTMCPLCRARARAVPPPLRQNGKRKWYGEGGTLGRTLGYKGCGARRPTKVKASAGNWIEVFNQHAPTSVDDLIGSDRTTCARTGYISPHMSYEPGHAPMKLTCGLWV